MAFLELRIDQKLVVVSLLLNGVATGHDSSKILGRANFGSILATQAKKGTALPRLSYSKYFRVHRTANESILTDQNRRKREFVMGGLLLWPRSSVAGFQIERTTTVLKARSYSRAPSARRRLCKFEHAHNTQINYFKS